MNYERLIKLEQLIKTSPILSPQEREEWLALLDLMNDKQLLELEKILQVQSKPKEDLKPEMKPAVPTLKPEVVVEKKSFPTLAEVLAKTNEQKKVPEVPKVAVPKLGHLMNLPTGFANAKKPINAVSPASLLKNLQHTGPLPSKTVGIPEKKPEASKTAFWTKIKDILSEKELKPGHESVLTEKELASGKVILPKLESMVAPTTPSSLKTVVSDKPKISIPASQEKLEAKPDPDKVTFKSLPTLPNLPKPGLGIPVPKPKVRPQAVSLKFILKQSDQAQEKAPEVHAVVSSSVSLKPVLPPVIPKINGPSFAQQQKEIEKLRPKQRTDFVSTTLNEEDLTDTRYLNALKHQGVTGKEEVKVVAGVKLDEVRARADSSKLFGSLKGLRPEDKTKSLSHSQEKIKLLSPQDLKKLTAENFYIEDEALLVKSIKEFIKNFGYHEIVFAIEQSPLFKSYIDTGAKILSGQAQFGEEGVKDSTQGLLKQEEFEKIADLLMEIQTA